MKRVNVIGFTDCIYMPVTTLETDCMSIALMKGLKCIITDLESIRDHIVDFVQIHSNTTHPTPAIEISKWYAYNQVKSRKHTQYQPMAFCYHCWAWSKVRLQPWQFLVKSVCSFEFVSFRSLTTVPNTLVEHLYIHKDPGVSRDQTVLHQKA